MDTLDILLMNRLFFLIILSCLNTGLLYLAEHVTVQTASADIRKFNIWWLLNTTE